MHRPQFVQSLSSTSRVALPVPRSAGVMTCGSGQTAKQSPQSVQASRAWAAMRTTARLPSNP
jgi:hypothetical protein